MPPIYLGESNIEFPKMKLGSSNVQKIYLNEILVYPEVIASGMSIPSDNKKE